MNVLSLFDGCGMAFQALKNLNIKIDNYFASEIDPYATKIANKNHPEIIQLMDVAKVNFKKLPKIDLLIGGSPCQGFSFAGKQLNFGDPRSKLFFEFVRAKEECTPKYFLLENVKMKKEHQDVISSYLGVAPILINSSRVSAQNRERLYWTNIPNITQPDDLGVYLPDIIESGVVDREKAYCLDASYYKGSQNGKLYFQKSRRQIVITENETVLHNLYKGFKEDFPHVFNEKHPTIRANSGGGTIPSVFTRYLFREKNYILMNRLLTVGECEALQTLPRGYTDGTGVSKSQRYKMLGNGFTVKVIEHLLKSIPI